MKKTLTALFKMAFRNVRLHWRQSLGATIALSAGLISLVMFQGYMKDVERIYRESFRSRMMYGDVIIENQKLREPEGRAEAWKYAINPDQWSLISDFLKTKKDSLIAANRVLMISGVVANGKTSTIFRGFGYDIGPAETIRGEEWSWDTLYGSPLSSNPPNQVVLGQSLGKILGCLPQKKEKIMNAVAGYKAEVRPFDCVSPEIQLSITTPEGQLNALDLSVVGLVDALYKDVDNKYLAVSLESAQTLMNTEDISYATVKFRNDGKIVDETVTEFNKMAQEHNLDLRMIRWEKHIVGDMYVRTMDLLSIFRNFVVTIIVAIAGLSIFNTMMKMVTERTREIGTLQSIGFLAGHILFIFVSEAFLLSLIGGVIGTVIALISTFGVNAMGILYKAGVLVEPVPFRIMIDGHLYLLSFVFLSLLAGIATLLVARSTVHRKPAENLTYV